MRGARVVSAARATSRAAAIAADELAELDPAEVADPPASSSVVRSGRWVGADGWWNLAAPVLLAFALADLVLGNAGLRLLVWLIAVTLVAGTTLLTAAAAERLGNQQIMRWQAQALASLLLMVAEMAHSTGSRIDDPSRWIPEIGVAILFVATAANRLEGHGWGVRSVYLLLDAMIVAATIALGAVVLAGRWSWDAQLSVVLVATFSAAGYAVVVATRGAQKDNLNSSDGYLLGGVAVLFLHAAGEACKALGIPSLTFFGAPGLVLLGAALLGRSAWLGLESPESERASEAAEDSRLRLAPAVAAGVVILLLAGVEATGSGTRVGFFGVVTLFALVGARLALALVENRELLRRVERSGVFEVKLRDLGSALLTALDQTQLHELVCRTAQAAIGADAVLLWMVDPTTSEMEAVEVLGPKRRSVLHRRMLINEPTSLAARIARTGEAEIVQNAMNAGASNQFLNVLMHAESLLGVPVAHGRTVQGVLVCVDSRDPAAYGPQELAKAELLASQVAVSLDNAYQHDLQRRRLDEVTALYQFGQLAHTALTATDIAKQLLPILKDRLQYTYASVWLRDPVTGTLRLSTGDSPGGVPLTGMRPSRIATRAFTSGEPVRVGLDWGDADPDVQPERSGVRSQLAVPMLIKHRVVGVVDLENRQPNAYSLNDERLLVSLANHSALAIDNLHLVEETRKVEAFKELDRMKSELLSTVSHELRTPLASIKGYATTLLTHETKLKREDRREFLEIIDSEADRLRELIENLLDASRLEAGVLRMDKTPSRLGEVARDVVRKVELSVSRHQVVLDWPEDREVLCDARRVYQVMQNLVTNAIKYAPEGGRVTLSGRFAARELVVSVADEGVGLPAREVDRIFDRFHRVGGEISRLVGGTGLGLAISKGLVEAHGGRIWAESEGEGKGSTFRFTLPVNQRAEATSRLSKGAHDHQEANGSGR